MKTRHKVLKISQEELTQELMRCGKTIAKALNTTVAYLIGERDDPKN